MEKEKRQKSDSFSVLESVALEVESFSRDVKAALLQLDAPEKTAASCAFIMFWSCFLPWFSPTDTHTQSGMDGFATPHFGISVAIVLMLHRLAKKRAQNAQTLETGRIALTFLFLGALSTISCIALLIHFGDIATHAEGPSQVRFGFYTVLLCGIGLSGCGIAKLR
jgi:hypothetical protein